MFPKGLVLPLVPCTTAARLQIHQCNTAAKLGHQGREIALQEGDDDLLGGVAVADKTKRTIARNKQVAMATPGFAVTTGKVTLASNTKLELTAKRPHKGAQKMAEVRLLFTYLFLVEANRNRNWFRDTIENGRILLSHLEKFFLLLL